MELKLWRMVHFERNRENGKGAGSLQSFPESNQDDNKQIFLLISPLGEKTNE